MSPATARSARRGYIPVPLHGLCNAGADLLLPGPPVPLGAVPLRGFPFEFATDPQRCVVALGGGLLDRVEITIDDRLRHLLVLHRLLDSGANGDRVATYTLVYDDATVHAAEVRDRFEITTVPPQPYQYPFCAVPDAYDSTWPRWEGRFEMATQQMREADQAALQCLWLWSIANPRPDRTVRSVRIDAAGPRFAVAALTLSTLDESPLRLPPGRLVRVDLDDAQVAARSPIDLTVHVDRGFAGYAYALPAQGAAEFLADPVAGFGQDLNPTSSPAYARVTALPSATVTLMSAGSPVGSVAWRDLDAAGEVQAGGARIRIVDGGRNWVHTEVVDAGTGTPVSCRIHLRSDEGVPHPPYGHHAHVAGDRLAWHLDLGGDVRLGGTTYAYVDGSFEGWLPRGRVLVDLAQGFEYEPLRTAVEIEPGQQRLRLELRRLRDLNADGWFSGDTHVHFLSTPGSHLEARGEGLNVVNLLQSQWGHLFTNIEDFTGEPSVSADGRTVVYTSQENRQHFLGHVSLLGLKRPVMPWCSDGPEPAELGGSLEATMSEWADRCHEQGGTVILPHLPGPNAEPAAMVATGRLDAIELCGSGVGPYNHAEYYRYLNAGYRLPLVGGTDKMTSDVPVGLYRTYVHMRAGEEFSYQTWCRNLERGRTFMTGGPLLFLRVEGGEPGDTLHVPRGGTLHVEVEAVSVVPMHRLEVVCNGEVVASTCDTAGTGRLHLQESVRVTEDSWIAARAGGPGYFDAMVHRDLFASRAIAHTSPVYVTCGEEYARTDPAALRYMLTVTQGCLDYIHGVSPQHAPGSVTHHHGEADHLHRLSQPFLEAQRLLRARLEPDAAVT